MRGDIIGIAFLDAFPYVRAHEETLVEEDAFVWDETPLITKDYVEPTAIDRLIGRNCSELVPDGACLQMGIGSLPNAVCSELTGHQHLGLHT